MEPWITGPGSTNQHPYGGKRCDSWRFMSMRFIFQSIGTTGNIGWASHSSTKSSRNSAEYRTAHTVLVTGRNDSNIARGRSPRHEHLPARSKCSMRNCLCEKELDKFAKEGGADSCITPMIPATKSSTSCVHPSSSRIKTQGALESRAALHREWCDNSILSKRVSEDGSSEKRSRPRPTACRARTPNLWAREAPRYVSQCLSNFRSVAWHARI